MTTDRPGLSPEVAPCFERFRLTYPSGTVIDCYSDGSTLRGLVYSCPASGNVAQVKVYGHLFEGQRRYSPPEIIGTERICCQGNPDPPTSARAMLSARTSQCA